MKRLLVFFTLFLSALYIDITPVSLKDCRDDTIRVLVDGAVDHPGEVELPMYATVEEALETSGVSENADLSSLNPQMMLKDKDVLIIPEEKEDSAVRISINTGSMDDLCSLPGIGSSTAEAIIAYREEYGLFQNVEEIMQVKGIGQAKFEKIRDLICL
jgi:competence protein ComEA